MKKWEILAKFNPPQDKEAIAGKLIALLLKNRKIQKGEIKDFLNPSINDLTPKRLGLDPKMLLKTKKRIEKAKKENEGVIVFGDYDVDGITGAAILWETLNGMGQSVLPYIPHRIDEGYGLSAKGIENVLDKYPNTKLIITVDNGIVANQAVEFANTKGIDVIITDHHVPSKKTPNAHSIVHTTKICGAGVAWALSRYLEGKEANLRRHLELVALATVADVMGLTGANRTFARLGIDELRRTRREGLLALFKDAGIDQATVGVYEIGHIIAPRLNATGRIEHAIESLRLICTKDPQRATLLAQKLSSTNLERQRLTVDSFEHAKGVVSKKELGNFIYISHESYQPGVIGLIAGKLVEEFYRPTIVISKGELVSKASARSISGFNIVEFIRASQEFLIDVGGHPMAAGFTVETQKIELLSKSLEKTARKTVLKELLQRKLRIDTELPIELISERIYSSIQNLSPFGPGNPEPVFIAKKVLIESMQLVGMDKKHLKLSLSQETFRINAIAFGFGNEYGLAIGDEVDLAYSITQNVWNEVTKLELKVKDIKKI